MTSPGERWTNVNLFLITAERYPFCSSHIFRNCAIHATTKLVVRKRLDTISSGQGAPTSTREEDGGKRGKSNQRWGVGWDTFNLGLLLCRKKQNKKQKNQSYVEPPTILRPCVPLLSMDWILSSFFVLLFYAQPQSPQRSLP